MEKARLEEFNPWWLGGKVDPELALSYKRGLYHELVPDLKKRFILALVGLRRTGKTTLMYQLVQHLLEEGIPPANVLFFSFDEYPSTFDDVLNSYREINTKDLRAERTYVFLDEIQKLDNWQNTLKKYYDLYPKLKFIISGSESLFIRKKTKETMAGRVFESVLHPLDFREYLELNGIKEEALRYETAVLPLFLRFAGQGGFPETIPFTKTRELKTYVKSLVIDKIIYNDIPRLFHIEDPEFLVVLLELIAANPGMYVDYQSLAQQFGKDRRVIKDYLFYLKESFLIRLVGNYRKGSVATTLRKKKRAYPTDAALIQLYKPSIDEQFFGRIVETAVVNALDASFFWKNSHEVDVVVSDIPVEVKYQETIVPSDLNGVREFMRKFKKTRGIVVTKKDERTVELEEGSIQLVPAWTFLLRKNGMEDYGK